MQACFRQSLFLGTSPEPPSVRAEAAHLLRVLFYFPKTVRNERREIEATADRMYIAKRTAHDSHRLGIMDSRLNNYRKT